MVNGRRKHVKTIMAKPGQVERKWYVVDAAGKPLGRLSAGIARILMGKHKPIWTPGVDCGDFVIVINAEKVALSGSKELRKCIMTTLVIWVASELHQPGS